MKNAVREFNAGELHPDLPQKDPELIREYIAKNNMGPYGAEDGLPTESELEHEHNAAVAAADVHAAEEFAYVDTALAHERDRRQAQARADIAFETNTMVQGKTKTDQPGRRSATLVFYDEKVLRERDEQDKLGRLNEELDAVRAAAERWRDRQSARYKRLGNWMQERNNFRKQISTVIGKRLATYVGLTDESKAAAMKKLTTAKSRAYTTYKTMAASVVTRAEGGFVQAKQTFPRTAARVASAQTRMAPVYERAGKAYDKVTPDRAQKGYNILQFIMGMASECGSPFSAFALVQ